MSLIDQFHPRNVKEFVRSTVDLKDFVRSASSFGNGEQEMILVKLTEVVIWMRSGWIPELFSNHMYD